VEQTDHGHHRLLRARRERPRHRRDSVMNSRRFN
jgi:hypothetical protein